MTTSLGSSTTIFVGSHYEVTDGVITKYYFAGAQRIAMRTDGTLTYILGDHLGSTSIVTDSIGNVLSQQRYKAWGETRYSSGSMSTKYQYTGQFSYELEFGLQFFNARWYDSSLGRFAQADSIVPGGVQGLDRYAYGLNNPSRYTDPSGHVVCEIGEPCGPGATYRTETTDWKKIILDKFGVDLSDDGAQERRVLPGSVGRKWDEQSMIQAYRGLSIINNALNGRLKNIVGSVKFTLNDHPPVETTYYGYTSGTTIDFYADSLLSLENIYHEFGHVMNSLPGRDDEFSDQLGALDDPTFILNNKVNPNALINPSGKFIQASTLGVKEQWADVFLNYVAGNINPNSPEGLAMNQFITRVLATDMSR